VFIAFLLDCISSAPFAGVACFDLAVARSVSARPYSIISVSNWTMQAVARFAGGEAASRRFVVLRLTEG
jgi:hypothetical protein